MIHLIDVTVTCGVGYRPVGMFHQENCFAKPGKCVVVGR